ncbi:MAG: hypothetical protein II398_11930, partial [Prevotella sp.]|nr:hypothetical protein [Prevotella sp.]
APWADLVVGQASFRRLGDVSAINDVEVAKPIRTVYYNMAGQQVSPNGHGPYIEKSMMANGSTSSRVIIFK